MKRGDAYVTEARVKALESRITITEERIRYLHKRQELIQEGMSQIKAVIVHLEEEK